MIIIVRRILKIRKIGILGRNRDNGSENKKSKKEKKKKHFGFFRVSSFKFFAKFRPRASFDVNPKIKFHL